MNTAASLRVIGLSRGLFLGLLGSTLTLSAHAGGIASGNEQQTISVSYAGLDLSDPAAMRTLYGRLKDAAVTVCGGDIYGERELHRIVAHKTCVGDALEAAVQSIDNAELTALHRSSEAESPVS